MQKTGIGVQQRVEEALQKLFPGAGRLHGSSRTDTGVHALGMVAHVEIPRQEFRMPLRKLALAINSFLPEDIRVLTASRAPAKFHARFDAKGKVYRYHLDLGEGDPFVQAYCWILNRKPDWKAVRAAAKVLEGKHDFWAFSGENDRTYETTVRTLRRLAIKRVGRKVSFTFEADGFLYKMVRSLTGALVNVGLGKLTSAEIAAMLKNRKRIATVVTAPPDGLFLVRVVY